MVDHEAAVERVWTQIDYEILCKMKVFKKVNQCQRVLQTKPKKFMKLRTVLTKETLKLH